MRMLDLWGRRNVISTGESEKSLVWIAVVDDSFMCTEVKR